MDQGCWVHTINTNRSNIMFSVKTPAATLQIAIHFDEPDQIATLVITFERHCPNQFINTMGQFCNFCNTKIPFGFFCVDCASGETSYRSACDTFSVNITPDYVDNFIRMSVGFCNAAYNALNLVADGYSLEHAQKRFRL